MLMTGDIVQATVQPFNGLTDTLQIFGLRVAASLPPNVYPGDTLTVSVQGFANDQVQVQVMSRTPSPNAPPTPPPVAAAAVPQEPDSVELTRMPIPMVVDESEFPPLPPPPVALVFERRDAGRCDCCSAATKKLPRKTRSFKHPRLQRRKQITRKRVRKRSVSKRDLRSRARRRFHRVRLRRVQALHRRPFRRRGRQLCRRNMRPERQRRA